MTRARRIGSAAAALLFVSGCTHVRLDATHALVPVSMTSRIGRPGKVIGHFKTPVRTSFLLWRFWTIRDVEVNEIVESAVARWGGDGVANLRIVGETGVVDSLLNYGVGLALGAAYIVAVPNPAGQFDGFMIVAQANLAGVGGGLFLPFFRTYTVEGDVVKFGLSHSEPPPAPAPAAPAAVSAYAPTPASPSAPASLSGSSAPVVATPPTPATTPR